MIFSHKPDLNFSHLNMKNMRHIKESGVWHTYGVSVRFTFWFVIFTVYIHTKILKVKLLLYCFSFFLFFVVNYIEHLFYCRPSYICVKFRPTQRNHLLILTVSVLSELR